MEIGCSSGFLTKIFAAIFLISEVFAVEFYYDGRVGSLILSYFALIWKQSVAMISSIRGRLSAFFCRHLLINSEKLEFMPMGRGVNFSLSTFCYREAGSVAIKGFFWVQSS